MSSTVGWYNKIAPLYNLLNLGDRVYWYARQEIIEMLNLEEGDVVVDLFCGTGVNFAYLLDDIGETGHIIAIDGSDSMLTRARQRIQLNSWSESRFTLLQRDLSDVAPNLLDNVLPEGCIPKVLITLALTVFPNYKEVFERLFTAMPSDTRFGLMEIYATPQTRGYHLLNLIGSAEVSRPVWEPLKVQVAN